MSASFDSQLDSQFGSHCDGSVDGSEMLAHRDLPGMNAVARAAVVNRTHRVVRQRAKVMQARRSRARGLVVPLVLCSVLLLLAAAAVWSGLYQYQAVEAAEAVQADVATALAATDANNHFLVMLLWFVPVSLVLLGTVLFRRGRGGANHETVR